jgi:hypothetical protein
MSIREGRNCEAPLYMAQSRPINVQINSHWRAAHMIIKAAYQTSFARMKS